LTSEA